ncbi:MAG: hypothetical protein LC800_09875, partial [Acidobacteria bacterium]|nr:hypothetical protein [Acidobacteriota bacterium]
MKVYEDESMATDAMNSSSILKLEDDGQFRYDEQWSDFAGSTGVTVEGSWRHDGGAVVLHPLSVSGTIGSWVVGEERKAVERGDTLDFGGGFTLRVPPEREEDVPVRNTGKKPLTVVLEPWGTRHEVAPGEVVRVVARGPGGMGGLEIVRGEDEVVVYGWSESLVAVVPEPKSAAPPPRAAAPRPLVAPRTPAPLPVTRYPRFKLPTPSPELAALIRRWTDELPAKGLPDWLMRLCMRDDAIPLHIMQFDVWVLRPDGYVLCIDHDSVAQWAEPETDPVTAYAVLAQGARDHPE